MMRKTGETEAEKRRRWKTKVREARKAPTYRHVVDEPHRSGPPREPCPIQCKTCCDQPWRRERICEECRLPYEAERLRQA